MGKVAIVGLGKGWDRNPAPVSDYGNLYHALQGASNRFIVINGGGEAVGPSAQLGKLYTPQIVAEYIKHGGVWVDYCGFPFFYTVSSAGAVQTLGQSGWKEFVSYLGYGWLRNQKFYYPGEYTLKTQYPFRRGFPLNQSLTGVCYDPNSFTRSGFLGVGGGTFPLAADGFAAVVALHPAGGGYYFYGSYRTGPDQLFASAAPGVPTSDYANFIRNVLRGNTGGYACRPYHIAVQSTHHVTPGVTSPVKFQHHTAHTAHSAHTSHPTSTAGSNKLAEDILAGTLVAGGVALGTVLIWRHRRG